jgi:hypothetical protein
MATTVHFTGKDGKADKVTFPTRTLAEIYGKTVKGARFEETSSEVAAVAVQKCPVATAELQKNATKTYYRSVKTPKRGVVIESSESEAEEMAEHFADCRAAGVPMQVAFEDWDYRDG